MVLAFLRYLLLMFAWLMMVKPEFKRQAGSYFSSHVAGLRGGFVPPFVRKAAEGPSPEDEEAGPLSAKTKQLLAGEEAGC